MNIGIIIASIVISAVIFFFIGVAYRKKIAESKIQSAEEEAKKILDMHAKRYEKGQSSFLNLMQVETMYQETLRDYIGAMEVYYNAYLDLMHNVGHDILLQDEL